ncbi:MAG: hypothetical protein IPG04_29880 [Polyangiaceae bacterium]|nr:hypothetical protein [Polyangiaceae bacterium]
MSAITGIDRLRALGVEWDPAGVERILRIVLTLTTDGATDLLLVALFQPRDASTTTWPSDDRGFIQLELHFAGVRDCAVKVDALPLSLRGFSVDDVASRGWEGIQLEVQDYENGTISFICQSMTIALPAEHGVDQ